MSPVNEDYISYDSNEQFASHVAISPDGQFICTLNCNQTINFFDRSSISEEDANNFVEIPKISSSENDDLVPYRIEYGALHEYMHSEAFDKKYGSGVIIQEDEKSNRTSTESKRKEEDHIPGVTSRSFPSWSLAISNKMEHQGEHVIFVAISAIKPSHPDLTEGKTAIYRIRLRYNSLIQKPACIKQYNCHDVAGIVMFVKKESNNPYAQYYEQPEHKYLTEMLIKTSCFIINAEGIYKVNYSIPNNSNSKIKEEKFSFPKRLEKELKSWYRSKHCMDRLLSCIYHHYFFVDQYKDSVHTIDMYNLSTMEQEQIFIIRHDETVSHTSKNVSSVFAVSQNKQLIACSNGERSVTLFWIENGLDVGVKEFGTETKILYLEFIENDEKLLIITEETCTKEDLRSVNGEKHDIFDNKQKPIENDVNYDKLSTIMEEEKKNPDDKIKQVEQVKLVIEEKEEKVKNDNLLKPRMTRRRSSCKDIAESVVTKIMVWDLFSSADNAIRTGMTGDLFPSKENYHSHLARVPGVLYHMKDDGNVFSILEHDGFVNLVKGEERDLTRDFGCDIYYDFKTTQDQKDKMSCVYANNEEVDVKLHKVYCRKEFKTSGIYKVIVNNKEPWIYMNNYHRTSVFLDEDETLQLIIGHSTVQIWRKLPKQKESDKKRGTLQKKEPVLEYIWANNIPFEHDIDNSRLQIKDLWIGDNSFVLKVYWKYDEGSRIVNNMETLSFPYTDGHVTPVLHACKALEHLNNRKNKIIDYKKMVEFERLVENTNRIVWRFVKKKPEIFKLMDVRYNVMSYLIRGGCNYLIKFILFDFHKNKQILHIPKAKQWISETEPERLTKVKLESKTFLHQLFSLIRAIIPSTDLEWAIEYCKDKERKDSVMVGYLLEYYSENALHHIGWMATISKALPLLYRYNLDYYVKPLFYKDCFADKELTQYDPSEIIPEHSKPRRNKTQDFKAFKPNTKLVSDKNHKPVLQNIFEFIIIKFPRYITNFIDNFDNDRAPPPVALRVVPLPDFTVDNIPKIRAKYNWKSNLLRLLKIIIIPRGYIIGREDRNLLSPFVQVVRYEKDNNIFDNPAMEAVIDFRWRQARNYFLQIFLAFIAYAVCFGVISWAYMSRLEVTGNLRTFLICVMMCFYYLAYYLIAVEVKQAWHHGLRASLNVSNLFDIISIITPCIVMSIFVASSFQLSDGFAKVQTSTGIIVCISFTMLLLWCEMLLYLRLLSDLDTIKQKTNGFSVVNTTTHEPIDMEMDSQFDPSSASDNPFSNFLSSVEATYFWINGVWPQRDDWNYWAIEVLSLLGSVFIVTILQNMLIAFMGGVYEEAAEKGRDALLRYRATLISDYEALEDIRFWPPEPDPQFIFYVGHSKSVEEWTEDRKQFKGCMYQKYENKASYKRYKFQEDPNDKYSLLKYEMDKKDTNSSISSITGDGNIVSGSSLPLDETFKDFQRTVNDKLVNMDQNINQITDIQNTINSMQELFTVFMKKLDNIESKQSK
ncbi:19860_t:CDS:10 [Rhizophagus irregularis]|nr:19860_t:CDS:10 [Rhizophagus irregularis]